MPLSSDDVRDVVPESRPFLICDGAGLYLEAARSRSSRSGRSRSCRLPLFKGSSKGAVKGDDDLRDRVKSPGGFAPNLSRSGRHSLISKTALR